MTEHTESCKKFRLAYEQRKLAYEAHWGKSYCHHCNGWGYTSYRDDPSPAGVSLGSGSMEFSDPCSFCVEIGACPRCGLIALDEDGNKCSNCGWVCMEAGSEGLDPEPECECWIDQDIEDARSAYKEGYTNHFYEQNDWLEEPKQEPKQEPDSGIILINLKKTDPGDLYDLFKGIFGE